ncbi:MAG: cytochrome c family protein [Acetobacteraceae bacterium]|nr:cytochrome c family protein [Acetobacteraceae bacterium]
MRIALAAMFALGIAAHAAPAAAQDVAAGQRVFNQCRACHTINEGGRHGVGPNLWNIYGARAGQREGFRYSANMAQLGQGGLTWTEENLRTYIRNPRDLVPQGSMAFAGIRNDQQLADLIAYLRAQRPGG